MGLEDAETLARLLAYRLKRDPTSGHAVACKQYSDLRMPRLARVYKKAAQTASMKHDMGLLEEMMMFLVVWVVGEQDKRTRKLRDRY